jgi:FKBP-type peptidyl-prolyl cis-trans isomerase 2
MEEGLIGLEAGETDTLTIPPEKAYGQPSDENVEEFETDELRELLGGQLPEEGAYLEAQDGSQGEVVHVDDDTVRADFNPPLAGETLTFDVEILEVN